MKKLALVLGVVALMAACTSTDKKPVVTTDTVTVMPVTVVKPDTTKKEVAPVVAPTVAPKATVAKKVVAPVKK